MALTNRCVPLRFGLVIASHGRRATVLDDKGQRVDCAAKPGAGVLTGDRVQWCPLASGRGRIENRLARRTVLSRPQRRGPGKAIAANVDLVAVVAAPVPAIEPSGLDAYLVAAEQLGLTALLVLNKVDLLTGPERDSTERRLSAYADAGYSYHLVSAAAGTGIAALREALTPHCSVLVGPSGVGKSSVSARLIPHADPTVGALTRSGKAGRHTTSTSRLYFFDSNPPEAALAGDDGPHGCLIDAPGIREFGLWSLPARAIADGFPELREAAVDCRFRNCLHRGELGCAVPEALERGRIAHARYESYRALIEKYGDGGPDQPPNR